MGDGHAQREPLITREDIALPSSPGNRVALLHQQAITKIGRGLRIIDPGRLVEAVQDDLVAAIVHLEDQLLVPPAQVDRPQEVDVAADLDQAARISRRLVEVGDGGVAGVQRIEPQINRAGDPLVGARRTEGMAVAGVEPGLIRADPPIAPMPITVTVDTATANKAPQRRSLVIPIPVTRGSPPSGPAQAMVADL
ncbi:MAG: hypothetical protein E6I78_06095 [Chloroflexi bacterium]|nr:MAG: hypothetical protein E6I78_06095 [Chloroflexota bacterium]